MTGTAAPQGAASVVGMKKAVTVTMGVLAAVMGTMAASATLGIAWLPQGAV